MTNRFRNWFFYLALLPVVTSAGIPAMFYEDGTPTSDFKRQLADRGLPEILKGATLHAGMKDEQGHWRVLPVDACLTIRFHISPQGAVDKYVVLDSEPENAWTQGIVNAIANWRFASSQNGAWVTLPATYAAAQSPRATLQQDRHRSNAECTRPWVRIKVLAENAEVEQMDDPVAPRSAVRAKLQGCNTLTFLILPDGSTADYELLDAVPTETYDLASAVAVASWKYNAVETSKTRRGFARFDYRILSDEGGHDPRPCMEPQYAADHYLSTAETK